MDAKVVDPGELKSAGRRTGVPCLRLPLAKVEPFAVHKNIGLQRTCRPVDGRNRHTIGPLDRHCRRTCRGPSRLCALRVERAFGVEPQHVPHQGQLVPSHCDGIGHGHATEQCDQAQECGAPAGQARTWLAACRKAIEIINEVHTKSLAGSPSSGCG
jgi:hypothetical protein